MQVRERLLEHPEARKAQKKCFGCGMCVGGCPVARVEVYDAVANLHKALNNRGLDGSIWLCATCYKCQDTCPYDVKMTDLIYEMRRLWIEEHSMPAPVAMLVENLRKFGYSAEIEDMVNKKRRRMGLPAVEVTDEVRRILEECDRVEAPT